MRRLPIYFLIDVSESMVGTPIKEVETGMRTIVQELRTDPYALETAFISVIAFAGKAKTLVPLTELYKFYPPIFPIGGGTSLGTALRYLMDEIDKDLVKNTPEVKGDWKPIIFLFTDGTPTDNPATAFARWNGEYRRNASLVVISIGDNANTQLFGEVSDNVLRLNTTDETSFKSLFRWITASIKTTSQSVCDMADDQLNLPPTTGVNLEKVDTTKAYTVDENFAVVLGKCSTTKQAYLIKYAKRIPNGEGGIGIDIDSDKFKLVWAYPIDEEAYNELCDGRSENTINTALLIGAPSCPCCGNQYGFVVCDCGKIMCSGGGHAVCPWCGTQGTLIAHGGDGMDVTKGIG